MEGEDEEGMMGEEMGKEGGEMGIEEGEGWMGWRKRGSKDSYTHTTGYK